MAPKDDSEVTALKKELNSLIEKIKVWKIFLDFLNLSFKKLQATHKMDYIFFASVIKSSF